MSIDLAEHYERTLEPLPELAPADFDRYLPDFKKRARPVILRQYHRNDPALANWSFEFFIDRLPNNEIDLDVGDAIVTDGLTFTVESLHDYLRAIIANDAGHGENVRYLQGFDLFAADPTLYDDISFPHLGEVAVREVRSGWIGPAGTVTGYHADMGDNQLSQVVGRKLVKFISPDQGDRVYRTRKYDPNGIVCAVNADKWDSAAHPRFADADAFYAVLEPGDSVFIPALWYHHVRSLDASISVNHVGYTRKQIATNKVADQARRFLHNRGLYGDTCTCHMTVDGKRVAHK